MENISTLLLILIGGLDKGSLQKVWVTKKINAGMY